MDEYEYADDEDLGEEEMFGDYDEGDIGEEDYGEEDYGEEKEEQEYTWSVHDIERGGLSGALTLGTQAEQGTRVGKLIEEARKKYSTPDEKFLDELNKIIMEYDDEFDITDDDRIRLRDIVTSGVISDIQYKNPLAFVLGYLASNRGKNMTDKSVNKAFNKLDLFGSDKGIEKPDVIRYARLLTGKSSNIS